MKKIILLVAVQALLVLNVRAQSIHGHVHEEGQNGHTPLIGASVFWLGTTTGSATDVKGEFTISLPEKLPAKLVASFVGFTTDTILVKNAKKEIEIHLQQSVKLGEVTVSERQEGSAFKLLDPIIAESINSHELQKSGMLQPLRKFRNQRICRCCFYRCRVWCQEDSNARFGWRLHADPS